MWKLITIKPIQTLRQCLPQITPMLIEMIEKYYDLPEQELNYKKLAQDTVIEVMSQLQPEDDEVLIDNFNKQLLDAQEKNDIDKVICVLDMFTAVAKFDKDMNYISQDLIKDIPNLIKQSDDERTINSAAALLSSL